MDSETALVKTHPFSEGESTRNEPIVRNITEIGRIIAHFQDSKVDSTTHRWVDAPASHSGEFFKGGVYLSTDEEQIPSVILQGHGALLPRRNFKPATSFWSALEYFVDGTFMASFDKGTLPEDVSFPAEEMPKQNEKYKRHAIRDGKWDTSVFNLDRLGKPALEFLEEYSNDALIAFRKLSPGTLQRK